MKRWVSTVGILAAHAQTVHIIATMRLDVPPSVRLLVGMFDLDVFNLELSAPECLVGSMSGGEAPPYYLVALGRLGALFALSFVHVTALVLEHLGRSRRSAAMAYAHSPIQPHTTPAPPA